MKKWIFAALAAMLFLPAAAQESNIYENSYIQTTGRAEKEVAPDEFYLAITIAESDSKGKISVEKQQHEMLKALKALGIDTDKSLKVENLASEFFRRGSMATANYELKLSSAAEVSRAWQALDKLGISEVSLDRVAYSKIDSLKQQVRAEAIRNARDTARTLAEAIDQKVGKCFYIYDSNSDIGNSYYKAPVMVRAKTTAEFAMDAAPEQELDFKSIKLQYSVQAKFILE